MAVQTITPKELDERIRRGELVELIDVRTPVEFREVHAAIACNVPLHELDAARLRASPGGSSGRPLYIICNSGGRSSRACESLLAAGCADVVSVAGGTKAWEAAGLAVVRGKKGIPLERQVRIAAGSLVLLGTVLGLMVHPAFFALPAFVGAGLVFAGLTDRCGMALLLARAPWNRVKPTLANPAPKTAQPEPTCCHTATRL